MGADSKMTVIIGRLESATLNGTGELHIILSKERVDLARILCDEIRTLEGKDVRLEIKERTK